MEGLQALSIYLMSVRKSRWKIVVEFIFIYDITDTDIHRQIFPVSLDPVWDLPPDLTMNLILVINKLIQFSHDQLIKSCQQEPVCFITLIFYSDYVVMIILNFTKFIIFRRGRAWSCRISAALYGFSKWLVFIIVMYIIIQTSTSKFKKYSIRTNLKFEYIIIQWCLVVKTPLLSNAPDFEL